MPPIFSPGLERAHPRRTASSRTRRRAHRPFRVIAAVLTAGIVSASTATAGMVRLADAVPPSFDTAAVRPAPLSSLATRPGDALGGPDVDLTGYDVMAPGSWNPTSTSARPTPTSTSGAGAGPGEEPVPEPLSIALMGLGLAGLAGRRLVDRRARP